MHACMYSVYVCACACVLCVCMCVHVYVCMWICILYICVNEGKVVLLYNVTCRMVCNQDDWTLCTVAFPVSLMCGALQSQMGTPTALTGAMRLRTLNHVPSANGPPVLLPSSSTAP